MTQTRLNVLELAATLDPCDPCADRLPTSYSAEGFQCMAQTLRDQIAYCMQAGNVEVATQVFLGLRRIRQFAFSEQEDAAVQEISQLARPVLCWLKGQIEKEMQKEVLQ